MKFSTYLIVAFFAIIIFSCREYSPTSSSTNGTKSDSSTVLFRSAASDNFCDNCNKFDSKIWLKAEWPLGRGNVKATNVSCSNGYYYLTLKSKTWDCGEIYTSKQYSYGLARSSFKCPDISGAISSIFFYEGVKSENDEIDIEIYKKDSKWRIDFVVYKKGNKNWISGFNPSFNPSSGFHEYAIDYAVGGIAFFVDGNNKGVCPRYISRPTKSMQIHLNCWWPTWLNATKPSKNKSMQIDFIEYKKI